MEEQREEMLNGSILAEERCKAADLVGKGCTDMLRNVLAQITDTRHYPREHNFLLEQL